MHRGTSYVAVSSSRYGFLIYNQRTTTRKGGGGAPSWLLMRPDDRRGRSIKPSGKEQLTAWFLVFASGRRRQREPGGGNEC